MQLQAAQDEGAEENVAQLGVGPNDLEQRVAADLDPLRTALLAWMRARKRPPARIDRSPVKHPFAEAGHVFARPARRPHESSRPDTSHEDCV